MRRRTARAIAKARKCALGGSVGPAPKSEKITGEFRNPAERAHGQPWLRPWYMSPRRAEESVGTRRPDDGPLIVPRAHSIARRADGGPVDEFAGLDPIAREAIRVENRGTRDPEQMAKNAQINQDFVLDNTPVVGNVRSARRALDSGSRAITAKHYGHTGKFRRAATEFVLDAAGAFAPLPWGRRAGEAAREGSSTARIFAGPSAKTADHEALKTAQEMKAAGAPREDIWRETGWFQGAEGKWRFEIPDNRATIDASKATARDPMVPRVREARFDEIMDHPEMFRAYPDLGEANVMHMPSVGRGGPRASYVGGPGDDEFLHFYGDGDRLTSSGLHEAQHAVQAREGFTVGGNMNAAFAGSKADPRAFPLYQERVKMMTTPISIEEYVRQAGFDNVDEAREGYATYLKGVEKMRKKGLPSDLDRMVQEDVARTWYNRLAGEVEARNVQSRQHMTPEERRAAPPWETQDIADDQQILRQRQPGDRQDVFVPVTDERILKAAQDARREGASNETIFKKFERSFFSPEGKLKRQIDDSRMTVTSPERFEHGDSVRTGDFVDHPELFAAQPHLADTKLTFMPDNTMDRRGVARTNPQSGNFELSLDTHDPKWYRRQLAKLMQYRVGQDARFSGAMRHGARNVLRDLDTAHGDAALLLAQGRTDPWAAGAYMRHLEGPREAMRQSIDTGKSTGIERKIGENSAGNVEAALVRSRVDTPYMNSIPYQPKQPGMNRPMGTPSFGEMTTLPPSNATLPEVDQFLREWYNYGAGREHKFARGGRVKRAVARGKAITGGIRGKTGGREDALPVDVPAGAYVIPADVVAALGGGNTEAGMHALDKKFGATLRKSLKNGGNSSKHAVPILISDGEYVLSPEAVEAAGGNDRLDELVVNTRKAYARHLAELPGPNQ
jgi:hypothetical protein